MSDVSAAEIQEPTDQKTKLQVFAENSRSLHEVAVRALNMIDKFEVPETKARMLSEASLDKLEGIRDARVDRRLSADQAAEQTKEFLDFVNRQVRKPFADLEYIGATAMKAERDTKELSREEMIQLNGAVQAVVNGIKFLENLAPVEFPPADKTAIANMKRVLKGVQSQLDNAEVVDLKAKNADVIERRENVPIPDGSTIDKAKAALHRERKDYIRELKDISEANAVRIIPGFEDRLAKKAAVKADYVKRIDDERNEEAAKPDEPLGR